MVRGEDERAGTEIERGAHQHGRDAAKAVKERLGDSAAEEWDADGQATHEHRGGAQRGGEFDQASLEPRSSGHSRNSYSANVTTLQCWQAPNFFII
ncbi:MAG TPA: hypothetical protein VIT43_02635 [Candidatus Dormibacteraeota bacterium]